MKLDINKGVKEFSVTPNAILLDVRTKEEYEEGHIKGSINWPLDQIEKVNYSKDIPLFVHCRSGRRSEEAKRILLELGYKKVKNIGGILDYTGEIEK